MNTSESPEFDPTIESLSTLSGIDKMDVTVQASLVLSSLAGPRASLVTLGDEIQSVGNSAISIAGNSPKQAKLIELLFSPLRILQSDLREHTLRVPAQLLQRFASQLSDPHRFDPGNRHYVDDEFLYDAELRHVIGQAGKSANAISKSHPVDRYAIFKSEQAMSAEQLEQRKMFAEMSPFAKIDYETMITHNEARCLREPLVFLENPDADTLIHAIDQVHHQSPMVLDSNGSLLVAALDNPNSKIARAIEGLLTSRSGLHSGDGMVTCMRGSILSIFDQHHIFPLIHSSATTRNCCSKALLVDVSPLENDVMSQVAPEKIRSGYNQYRSALQNVMRLRRLDAPGLSPILEDQAAKQFFATQREFLEQMEKVASRLKPYVSNFISLPATMLWSLRHLYPSRKFIDLVPLSIQLAEYAMGTHLKIIKHALEAGAQREIEEQAHRMLRKLSQYEPCRQRELFRKYDKQKKIILEPILNYLIDTDRVKQVEKGMLLLTDRARDELEGIGTSDQFSACF